LLRAALVSALWAVALYLLQFILLPWVLHLSSEFVWTARVQDGASMAARGYLWQLAWRDWVQAPWLGLGPMHYAHVPNIEAAHPTTSISTVG
jgi:O-antigen ligase